MTMTIITVYAPMSAPSKEDIATLYKMLEIEMRSIPNDDVLVVVGDSNAKIGQDAFPDWRRVVGSIGIYQRSSVAILVISCRNEL